MLKRPPSLLGVYYAKPALMPETPATQELSATKCQAGTVRGAHGFQERCQRKYGCLHFTYWLEPYRK